MHIYMYKIIIFLADVDHLRVARSSSDSNSNSNSKEVRSIAPQIMSRIYSTYCSEDQCV